MIVRYRGNISVRYKIFRNPNHINTSSGTYLRNDQRIARNLVVHCLDFPSRVKKSTTKSMPASVIICLSIYLAVSISDAMTDKRIYLFLTLIRAAVTFSFIVSNHGPGIESVQTTDHSLVYTNRVSNHFDHMTLPDAGACALELWMRLSVMSYMRQN